MGMGDTGASAPSVLSPELPPVDPIMLKVREPTPSLLHSLVTTSGNGDSPGPLPFTMVLRRWEGPHRSQSPNTFSVLGSTRQWEWPRGMEEEAWLVSLFIPNKSPCFHKGLCAFSSSCSLHPATLGWLLKDIRHSV